MTGTDTWDHSCAAGNRKEILQCEGTGVYNHAGSLRTILLRFYGTLSLSVQFLFGFSFVPPQKEGGPGPGSAILQ